MYLTSALVLNSGPLADLEVRPEFNTDGSPKPLVLVGANGAGKTNLLSIVADALAEIAAKQFSDVLPIIGMTHTFYRFLGGLTMRIGAAFELSALRFQHEQQEFYYRSKAGTIAPAVLAARMTDLGPAANWPENGTDKDAFGPQDKIEAIFRNGVYAFFPSNRAETPYWLNIDHTRDEPSISFEPKFAVRLCKPIVVQTALPDAKPWIVDVILDQSVDVLTVFRATDLDGLKAQSSFSLANV